MTWINLIFAAVLIAASPAAAQTSTDRAHEGDWAMADSTDNNTGEREVYAFAMLLSRDEPDFVTLTMRCSSGKPTIFVEWQDMAFSDQAVLTIGPIISAHSDSPSASYIFTKSEDVIERGMRTTPETSAEIIKALSDAHYARLTAHLTSGPRTAEINIEGTPRAWARVVRHCPIQTMTRPPL